MNEKQKEFVKEAISKFDPIKTMIAAGILWIIIDIVHALITKTIPPENREALINVVGVIEGALLAIVSFYFGSSKSSEKKDEAFMKKDNNVTLTPEAGSTVTAKIETETPKT